MRLPFNSARIFDGLECPSINVTATKTHVTDRQTSIIVQMERSQFSD